MKRLLISCFGLTLLITASYAQTVVLKASNNSGKTQYFVIRESSWQGEQVWGIKGEGTTGQVHSGDMWFNSFPGATGNYKVELGAVLEADGDPEYAVTAGSRLLKKGRYPYPDGASGYNCGDLSMAKYYINCGEHTINSGEKINLWGRSVYRCGSSGSWHGAYTRWFELRFTPVGMSLAPVTKITSPTAGANLTESKVYTLIAEGQNVNWSYDADSDGKATVSIGTGNSVQFTIPTGVTGAREITISAAGDNGNDQILCKIAATGIVDRVLPNTQKTFSLACSPDPFTVSTTITCNLPQTGNTTIQLYSSQGQLVHTLISQVMSGGSHAIPFTSELKEGVYYLVLKHRSGTQVTRLVKVK